MNVDELRAVFWGVVSASSLVLLIVAGIVLREKRKHV